MSRQVTLRDQRYDAIKGVISLSMTDYDFDVAATFAEKRWGRDGRPMHLTRATEVISDASVGAKPLIDTAMFRTVREQAVLFRLTGTRRVSFRTRSLLASGAVATWIAEGAPMPLHKVVFDPGGLSAYKLGAGTVATKEALNNGAEIERTLYDEITRGVIDELDATLLDPTNAGTADVAPAAITNGATTIPATPDAAADIASVIANFTGNLRAAYWTMHPTTAAWLATQEIGRDIGIRGGELIGAPVLTSQTAPTTSLALIDPTGLQVAHDDDLLLSASEAGAVELADPPTQDAIDGTGAQMIPLFQENLLAFKGRLAASWRRAKPDAVTVLQGGGSDWMA